MSIRPRSFIAVTAMHLGRMWLLQAHLVWHNDSILRDLLHTCHVPHQAIVVYTILYVHMIDVAQVMVRSTPMCNNCSRGAVTA
jgi:hypothetical protein